MIQALENVVLFDSKVKRVEDRYLTTGGDSRTSILYRLTK